MNAWHARCTGPSRATRTFRIGLKSLLAAILLGSLVACGGRRMPDLEPPEVSIVELFSEGDQSRVQLRLDNPVAAPMDIDWISLQIEIDGSRSTIDMAFDLTVPPLGSEVIDRPIELDTRTDRRLDYDLEGEVRLAGGRALEVKRDGRLYPTPGKPGSFR